MQIIFAFVTFLYLKIATEMYFRDGATVLASLLIAIVYGGLIFWAQLSCAQRIDRAMLRFTADAPLHARTVAKAHGVAIAIAILSALAIIVGFSDRLAGDLFGYRWDYEDIFALSLIVAVPGLVAMAIFWAFSRTMLIEHFRRHD